MNHFFTGQTRSRPAINLSGGGGAGEQSSSSSSSSVATTTTRTHGNLAASSRNDNESSSIALRARQERQARESRRKLDRAARRIQAFYRSRTAAGAARDSVRAEVDAILSTAGTSGDTIAAAQLLEATARLAFAYRTGNKGDAARLGKWARLVATGRPRVRLFQTFEELCSTNSDVTQDAAPQERQRLSRWKYALGVLSQKMCRMAADSPSSPSVPLFLELVKQLLDPAKYRGLPSTAQSYPAQLAASLVRHGVFSDLRTHILAFRPHAKPAPISLPAAIQVALSVLVRQSTSASDAAAAPIPDTTLARFTTSILTIPLLATSARLPASALAALSGDKSEIPYAQLLACIARQSEDGEPIDKGQGSESHALMQAMDGAQAAHFLANLLSIGAQGGARWQRAQNGKELVALLTAYKYLLGRIPVALLTRDGAASSPATVMVEGKGKSRATAIDLSIDTDEDGDIAMTGPIPGVASSQREHKGKSTEGFVVDATTYVTLLSMTREPFLSTIVQLSTRFSATSRPALSSFLVSLLYAFPASVKEGIVNSLVYSAQATSSSGLLREIWRGWVRSSALARAIASGTSSTSGTVASAVFGALADPKLQQDWPHFVLLAEMYARSLLTLGDDEFFGQSSGETQAHSRNPLGIDEVVGFSALLRNVAFGLYWQPEVLVDPKKGGPRFVGETNVSAEALRKLATGLLQSLHARDSRRQFTPAGHWIMTSEMDLHSFVESAIVEDQKLDEEEQEAEEESSAPTVPVRRGRAAYENDDMEEDEDERPVRRMAPARRTLPTRRQMAFVSPRLGVLNNIPFVIPFEIRVSIFQQFVANDRVRLSQGHRGAASVRSRFTVGTDGRPIAGQATIRRGHVADDGFAALSGLGSQLKQRLAIRFLDQYGQEEAGIDGGGLFKEFLTELSKEAFDVDRGLWLETSSHELYPASTSYSREGFSLQWYAFLGRILGKALYEGILVDVPFAPFFLSKWLGRASGFDDLASFEPDLYHGLVQLKNYPGDVEKDLSLNFTVTDDDFGVSRTIDLIPDGSNIPVTNQNRISYIYRVSDYRLNKQISAQCSAFFSGLSDLVNPKWLRMFNTVELGLLVGGAETSIDIDDLRHNTVYSRGYDESHETIQTFWRVVQGFGQADRKALVKFCTSCPRPPLLGFGQLNPKFAIGNGGADEERMPSTSTCVNLLKLPTYSTAEKLREKLLASINSGAGFDLS